MDAVPPQPRPRLRAGPWFRSAALDAWASTLQQSLVIDVFAIVPSELLDLWLGWLGMELRLGVASRSALPVGRALGFFYTLAASGHVLCGWLRICFLHATSSSSSAMIVSHPMGPMDQLRDASSTPRATGQATASRT